jgi:ubiquinone/menaquinone biosynthesis C-methylase UbiE
MTNQVSFKSLERQGWSERASIYDQYTGTFCRHGIVPLLDAAKIEQGNTVLDLCCGTGDAAAAAVARGARVTGIDIAEEMIAIAGSKVPAGEFRVGDAEALPFEDATFDRVICNFGLLHLPDPENSIAEASRVLKVGGRYAFTVWRGPEVSPFFRILNEAIGMYGTLDVGLPPAPSMFRFADKNESNRVLESAGFDCIAFSDIAAVMEFPLDSLSRFFKQAFVRGTMLLQAQTPEARHRIEQALQEQFATYLEDGAARISVPAVVVSGVRALAR